MNKCVVSIIHIVVLLSCGGSVYSYAQAVDDASLRQSKLEDLGRSLFFDVNLSLDKTQSCATCHDPARAFTDWRDSGVGAAASMGGDMHSLGDRNAPMASYAALIPGFQKNNDGDYVGGLFWDGRANSLEDQAAGPPLNPIEMRMPDTTMVMSRLQENQNYQYAFTNLYGDGVFADADLFYKALTESIAAFERTEFFAPFDSRYDRYLRGEYKPTEEETLGMTLFFSNQFTNCNQCHQLKGFPEAAGETFSNYTYHNIGVPANQRLRTANGKGADHQDMGLLENMAVSDSSQAGKFRVPSLRNVALTGPYMHNGVFADLETVVRFYNKYLTRSGKAQINPETGERWQAPEVPENMAMDKLEAGSVLDNKRIDAVVAFLKMLTDKRYESLVFSAEAKSTVAE